MLQPIKNWNVKKNIGEYLAGNTYDFSGFYRWVFCPSIEGWVEILLWIAYQYLWYCWVKELLHSLQHQACVMSNKITKSNDKRTQDIRLLVIVNNFT